MTKLQRRIFEALRRHPGQWLPKAELPATPYQVENAATRLNWLLAEVDSHWIIERNGQLMRLTQRAETERIAS